MVKTLIPFTIFGIIVGAIVTIGIYDKQINEPKRQRDAVKMSVAYNLTTCSTEYPIAVTAFNETEFTVKQILFSLRVYEQGFSDDLADMFEPLKWTRIVRPKESITQCWAMPRLLRQPAHPIVIFVDLEGVSFYKESENIPLFPEEMVSTTLGETKLLQNTHDMTWFCTKNKTDRLLSFCYLSKQECEQSIPYSKLPAIYAKCIKQQTAFCYEFFNIEHQKGFLSCSATKAACNFQRRNTLKNVVNVRDISGCSAKEQDGKDQKRD